jgi:hypothetical protein
MTRLTLPLRFRTEKHALGTIRDNSLFTIGAIATQSAGRWHVVIDTARPDAVLRYLAQNMPGVEWTRSDTP